MSGWRKLIKTLNDKKEVSRNKILRNEDILEHVHWFTICTYFDYLKDANFIKVIYKPIFLDNGKSPSFHIETVVLVKKIPESLTIKKAIAMGRKPWLQWFMEG